MLFGFYRATRFPICWTPIGAGYDWSSRVRSRGRRIGATSDAFSDLIMQFDYMEQLYERIPTSVV